MTKSELLKNAKPILFNTEMVRGILDGRKTGFALPAVARYMDVLQKAKQKNFGG